MEKLSSQDRSALIRLASSLPIGTPGRKELFNVLAAAVDSFKTVGGKTFKIRTLDFARFLGMIGLKGAEAGEYLREETLIPDEWLPQMKEFGAQFSLDPSTRGTPRPKGIDIDKLWDRLVAAMNKSYQGQGEAAGDMFVNMPPEYDEDDFDNFLQSAAGDVAQSYEDSLSDAATALHDKFMLALQTGDYATSYERWIPRERKSLLRGIAADAWYGEMSKGWKRIQANPKELARLKAMRPRR